ncbi:MAG: helix-turn-helix domain-containing protein, partial [Candidatus Cryptobacteroides sp.]
MTMLYGYTLSKNEDKTILGRSRNDEITNQFLNLIQKHFSETRDVASYAGMLCITPKYLTMAVKKSSGKTPLDWIDEYTNSAAKALLASTRLNINEISEKLNFSSQAIFGKFFKRVNGISPREYRKQLYTLDKTSNN